MSGARRPRSVLASGQDGSDLGIDARCVRQHAVDGVGRLPPPAVISAAIRPARYGAEKLVPLQQAQPSMAWPNVLLVGFQDGNVLVISSPGAAQSTQSPKFENDALLPAASTAATATTCFMAAGQNGTSDSALPAAATTTDVRGTCFSALTRPIGGTFPCV